MNRYVSQTAALMLGLCLAAPAFAQQGHQHGAAPASRTKAETASTQAYKAANMKMHKDMDIAYSGDADVDFLRGMIRIIRVRSRWRRSFSAMARTPRFASSPKPSSATRRRRSR